MGDEAIEIIYDSLVKRAGRNIRNQYKRRHLDPRDLFCVILRACFWDGFFIFMFSIVMYIP
jgi:hypothetical protein